MGSTRIGKKGKRSTKTDASRVRYRAENRRAQHKVARVLRANGPEAARAYAEAHGMLGFVVKARA